MIDHCIHCRARGDLAACQAKECANHRNWYAAANQVEIDRLRRRARNDRIWLAAFVAASVLAHAIESLANLYD